MFALNVSGDPGVDLLAIIISIVILLVIKGQFCRVYKLIFIDIIETACYINLCVFSAVRLKFGNDKIVSITASLSGVTTLTILVVVFIYHVYTTFCSNCFKRCQRLTEGQLDNSEHLLPNDNTTTKHDHCEVTCSIVELNLSAGGCKKSSIGNNQNSEESSESNDETASLISANVI